MKRDFKGVWIPRELYLDETLSWTEKILLIEIDSLDIDESKGCFASNKYLADFVGKSEGTVANIISLLKQRNYILQVFFDGRNRGLRTKFYNQEASRKRESRVHENMKAASRKREHNNTVNNTEYNIHKEFEIFWDKYHEITSKPKTSKEPAMKKWKKLTREERVKAINCISEFVQSLDTSPKYIPIARTYLSDKRFNDEMKTKPNNLNLTGQFAQQ